MLLQAHLIEIKIVLPIIPKHPASYTDALEACCQSEIC
ncbi:hypothetical protein ATPR_3426 [Acetobacter tropicalis NBRC 101654]|uniref:Uncharacterized protein n=1 Tax=Acetobacter tropicalis NBRC 101654 TaxID=749388 RepID=F7VJ77_9PROT|nr:hypothetical protein ATPR_3426 [Acetobacter tropicalis NBRC 101654]